MSEDFLKRWSRRKRDVAEAEQAKQPAPEDASHKSSVASGDERSIKPVEAIQPAEPLEPVFDLKELPPIESITAATDIRPFLAPGIPVDIARAALRRAWSADPRIRDFVGLADYDWDYHAVGGAAGFGPLEMTDELRRAVARILGEITEGNTAADAGRVVGTESTKESRASDGEVEAAPTALPHGPDTQAMPATVLAAPEPAFAVLQREGHQSDVHRTTFRRGHGRALPK